MFSKTCKWQYPQKDTDTPFELRQLKFPMPQQLLGQPGVWPRSMPPLGHHDGTMSPALMKMEGPPPKHVSPRRLGCAHALRSPHDLIGNVFFLTLFVYISKHIYIYICYILNWGTCWGETQIEKVASLKPRNCSLNQGSVRMFPLVLLVCKRKCFLRHTIQPIALESIDPLICGRRGDMFCSILGSLLVFGFVLLLELGHNLGLGWFELSNETTYIFWKKTLILEIKLGNTTQNSKARCKPSLASDGGPRTGGGVTSKPFSTSCISFGFFAVGVFVEQSEMLSGRPNCITFMACT